MAATAGAVGAELRLAAAHLGGKRHRLRKFAELFFMIMLVN
jgi:hypothetical protein